MLTATYCNADRLVRITWDAEGNADYAALGEVSDDELLMLAEAGGADVDGWTSELE